MEKTGYMFGNQLFQQQDDSMDMRSPLNVLNDRYANPLTP
jgi:hypothetical protein